MSNIVDLQKFKDRKEQKRLDEILEFYESEDEFAQELSFYCAHIVCENLYESGYDVESNPKSMRDIISVIESVRSIIERIRGTEYFFHSFSDSLSAPIEETRDLQEMLQNLLYGKDEDET